MDSRRQSARYSKAFIIVFSLLVLSAPFVLILSSFRAITFDLNYYNEKYTELDVYSNPRFQDTNLINETANLLTYLERGKGEIQTNFFNQREKQHLVEVRDLFRTALSMKRFFFFLTIILLIILFRIEPGKERFLKALSKYLIFGALLTIGVLLLSSLLFTNFDSSFITFHETLFKTDTWMLDPATDNMINMFPQQFFYDITKDIFVLAFVISAISIGVGLLLYYGPLLSGYYKRFITKKG
ncbi:MAG: TIGR01906 family membrane protein [Nanoarchaeota archaeon]|nr:TIGR01906 family membrane protein [Nanoarchaeota archaeon]